MNTQQIEVFTCLAREKSFTNAAVILHMSQSAVSKNLLALEKEMNVKLIERDRHSFHLTESGEMLLDWVNKTEKSFRNALEKASRVNNNSNFTIAILENLNMFNTRALVERMQNSSPKLRVSIAYVNYTELLEGIETNKYDLAVGIENGFSRMADVNIRHLKKCRSLLAYSPEKYGKDEYKTIDDFLNAQFYLPNAEQGKFTMAEITRTFAHMNVLPENIEVLPNMHTMLALISCGMGVSIINEYTSIPGSGAISFLDTGFTTDMAIAWRKTTPNLKNAIDGITALCR